MSAENRCVVGLDLGTTKISTVIAEIAPNKMPRILGFASFPSQGLRPLTEDSFITLQPTPVRSAA